jgi:hypothetical protein
MLTMGEFIASIAKGFRFTHSITRALITRRRG